MQRETIYALLESLPDNNGLYRNNPVVDPSSDWRATRLSHAVMDPTFAWKYVNECVKLGIWHLSNLCTDPMREAYNYLAKDRCDSDFITAVAIGRAPMANQRISLEAMLISPGKEMDSIARDMCISRRTLDIYENLFFSVRDRFNDTTFINNIVFPHTKQAMLQPGYLTHTDPSTLALQFAHNGGADAAMEWMGSNQIGKPLTVEQQRQIIQNSYYAAASLLAKAGMVHGPSHALNKVSSWFVAELANSNSNKPTNIGGNGLAEVQTVGEGVLRSLRRDGEPGYTEKVHLEGHAEHMNTKQIIADYDRMHPDVSRN